MHHLSILSYAVKRRVGLRRLRSLQRESWPLTASMMIKHLLVRSYEVNTFAGISYMYIYYVRFLLDQIRYTDA
ncbi:hypothetical protein ACJBU6_09208 [Exserohilum turcicum]